MSYKDSIASVSIPPYTKKQEMFNTISHVLGIPLALVILALSIIFFVTQKIDTTSFLGLLVFVFTIIDVYFVSSLYHSTANETFNKQLFRVIDHCSIFLLIAGTYTPICVFIMKEHVIGLIMLLIEWGSTLLGIILNAFFFKSKVVQIVSLILYLAMGWLVLFCGGFIYMSKMSFAFVLAGGIVYSIGAMLYAIGKKNLNFHSIFHIFVIVSTIVQAIGVLILFF